jgi:hypothetical protein
LSDGRGDAAAPARPIDRFLAAPRWQRLYLAGIVILGIAQTLGRIGFYRASFRISRIDIVLHLGLVIVLLAVGALILSLLPDRRPWRIVARVLAVVGFASLHALLILFDAAQAVMIHLTGIPAPFRMIRFEPGLLLSLIYSAGVGPVALALGLAALWAVHVLIYLPVSGLLVDGSRFAMALPVLRLRRRAVTLAWLLPLSVVALISLHLRHPVLWLQRQTFVIAPDALKTAKGVPSTARAPVTDLPHARPLVLIIVDALRRDRMGVYVPRLDNTPFLSGLRDRGNLHVFGPSYAPCTFSFCGIIGVLSSHSWNNFGSRPATIVDALGRHRYHSYLLLVGRHLDFGNMARLFGGPTAVLRDEEAVLGTGGSDDRRVLGWLRETSFPDPRHSFLYIHLMSTHGGAMIQPEYVRAATDSTGLPYALDYDARVREADDILRQIFRILREKGLGDAVIAITADHGERLGENGKLYHGGPPDLPAISVPLLIYDPSPATYPPRAIVSNLDAVPTLLRAVDAPIPPEWTGEALQRESARRAVPIGTGEETGVVAAIGGAQFRYLCDRDSGRERIARLGIDSGAESEVPIRRAPPGLLATLRRLHAVAARPIGDAKCRR